MTLSKKESLGRSIDQMNIKGVDLSRVEPWSAVGV
jgi:hypothetical protein